MSKQAALAILLIIVLSGIGLRAYQLTGRSLWFDEAFSWRLIQFPVPEMIARDITDVHPPLYYIVLKAWAFIFSSSLLSLRSFSVTLAAATIAVGYLFTAYLMRSRSPGLIAATLLALSGFQIRFAWEARMYTLGTALALLSSYLLLKAMRDKHLIWWLLYAITGAAFLYTHYYAFFTVFAQIIFVVGSLFIQTRGRLGEIIQSKQFWYGLLAAIFALILFAPWLPHFITQNSQVQASYWIPKIGGWSIPDTFYRMYLPTAGIPRHLGIGWIIFALLPITATILGWLALALLPGRRLASTLDGRWFVILSGIIPFLASIIISFFSQSLYEDRFFVFAHLFILVGLAILLSLIPWRVLRLTLIITTIVGFLSASVVYWYEVDIPSKPGIRAATNFVYSNLEPQDPVIVSSPFVYFAARYYAEETPGVQSLPLLYSEDGQLSHFSGGPILKTSDIIGQDVFAQKSDNLWVIDTTGYGGQLLKTPATWQIVRQVVFPEVYSYQGNIYVTEYQRTNF